MKFVNTQSRIIYISAIGKVNPGATTIDKYKDLEKCLQKIIDICGKNFRVVLNAKEAQLIAKLMELDEAGTKFDPSVIPLDVRRDPTGINRLVETERKQQHAAIEATAKSNKEAAEREALINGEVADKPKIRPLGVNRSAEGEKKEMSGFEQILAENARIAEQKSQEQAPAEPPTEADPLPDIPDADEEKQDTTDTPPTPPPEQEQTDKQNDTPEAPPEQSVEDKQVDTLPPVDGDKPAKSANKAAGKTRGGVRGKTKNDSKK